MACKTGQPRMNPLYVAMIAAFALMATGILAVLPGSEAQARARTAAERYVDRIGPRAIAVARLNVSKAERAQRYARLLRRYAAISAIASFSLGRYARRLPRSRRAEFNRLVVKFMANFFTRYTGSFDGRSIEIMRSRQRGPRNVVIDGMIHYYSGRSQPMRWRVVRAGSGYRVFDVQLLGVWLTLQLRQQFTSTLEANRGNFDALFAKLRNARP